MCPGPIPTCIHACQHAPTCTNTYPHTKAFPRPPTMVWMCLDMYRCVPMHFGPFPCIQPPSTCPLMHPGPVPTCIHASVLPHPAVALRYLIPVYVCSFSFLICPWGRFALSYILHMGHPSPTTIHNLPNMQSDGRDSWGHMMAQVQGKWGKG